MVAAWIGSPVRRPWFPVSVSGAAVRGGLRSRGGTPPAHAVETRGEGAPAQEAERRGCERRAYRAANRGEVAVGAVAEGDSPELGTARRARHVGPHAPHQARAWKSRQ